MSPFLNCLVRPAEAAHGFIDAAAKREPYIVHFLALDTDMTQFSGRALSSGSLPRADQMFKGAESKQARVR